MTNTPRSQVGQANESPAPSNAEPFITGRADEDQAAGGGDGPGNAPARPEFCFPGGTVSLPDANDPNVLVDTTVDPAGVEFTTDAAGGRHGKLLVLLVALNDNANGITAAQPDNPPQTSGALHLDFTPEQYRAILKTGIQFGLKLPLKPGSYRLRLGVSDMNNHRLGTLDMPVTIGAGAGLGIS